MDPFGQGGRLQLTAAAKGNLIFALMDMDVVLQFFRTPCILSHSGFWLTAPLL